MHVFKIKRSKKINLSGVSAYGTELAIRVTEDFWLIVTPRRVKMSQKFSAPPTRVPAEKLVRDIRRATRKHHSTEGIGRAGRHRNPRAGVMQPTRRCHRPDTAAA
jgi:hypothetical protein